MKCQVFALALLVSLTACGTSPEPGLYTLAPVTGVVASDLHDSVRIGRPSLAGFLDRPDFVSQSGDYQLRVNETVNWAEPLDTMFGRVLAADVQQRLPNAVVQSDEATLTSPPRFIVETSIQQFNPVNGAAVLRGNMLLTDRSAHVQPAPAVVSLNEGIGFGGSSATARALSVLIGRYADEVVMTLQRQTVIASEAMPNKVDPTVSEIVVPAP